MIYYDIVELIVILWVVDCCDIVLLSMWHSGIVWCWAFTVSTDTCTAEWVSRA